MIYGKTVPPFSTRMCSALATFFCPVKYVNNIPNVYFICTPREGVLGGAEFNIYCSAASISHFFSFFFKVSGLQSTANLMHLPDSTKN